MGKFVGIYDEKYESKRFVNTDKIISFHVVKYPEKEGECPYKLVIRYGVDGGSEGEIGGDLDFSFKEEKTANDVVTNILLKHGDL